MKNLTKGIAIRNLILSYRWHLVALVAIANILFEWLEHYETSSFEIRFGWEVFLFGFFYPLLAGWVLTLLQQTDASLIKVAQVQFLKQRFLQQLSQVQDWNELQTHLLQFLQDVASFSAIVVFVYDRDQNQFETAVEWHHPDEKFPELPPFLTIDQQAASFPAELHLFNRERFPEMPPTHKYSGYCLPLELADTTTALIMLFIEPAVSFTLDQMRLLNDTASTLALAVSTFHPLAAQPIWQAATVAERKRMARQLHDTIAQHLNLLRMKLQELKGEKVLAEITAVREELSKMNDIADLAYKQVRATLQSLQTPADLAASIQAQAVSMGELAGIDVDFVHNGDPMLLAPYIGSNILSITRELLLNVGKHAQATNLSVVVNWASDILEIIMEDDGLGFEIGAPQPEGHYGLLIIKERAQEINGRLTINSQPGKGTKVSFLLPLS